MTAEEKEHFMREALREAQLALAEDEVPVGAVIVQQGRIVARAHDVREATADPTAHAELGALREAARQLGDWRLSQCALFCTLEPCPMCAGALIQARLGSLFFAVENPKAGAVVSQLKMLDHTGFNHRVQYEGGILAAECSEILKRYFAAKRKPKIDNEV